MQALAKQNEDAGAIIEQVIINGDLANLQPAERVKYYNAVCQSVGLNPLTRPLEYITLNGKLTLYARKDATDQLRKIHGVSIVDMSEQERDGVLIVTAKAQDAHGRLDISKGAVSLGNLKGEALANAFMKCETKAKRRVTLSICGLGMLDETEVNTIPDARPVIVAEDGEIVNQQPAKVLSLPQPQSNPETESELLTPGWVREYARLKGIDIDGNLARQKKPGLDGMSQESLQKVYGWLQKAPNLTPVPEQQTTDDDELI
jgi:hypothetical protein